MNAGELDKNLLTFITTNIQDIIAIRGPKGRYRYVSQSVQKVLGYTQAEFLALAGFGHYHPDDRPLLREFLERVWQELPAAASRCEYRLRRKDGSYCWLESEASRMPEAAGEPAALLMIARDITNRKSMEKALQESETRLRDFAQALPDIGLIVDENGRCVEVFGQNDTLLLRPGDELRGRTLHKGLQANDADFLLNRVRQALTTRQPQTFNLELEGPYGTRCAEMRIVPMNYLANDKQTVAVVFTDVSDKQRAKLLQEFTMAFRRRSGFMEDLIQGKIPPAGAADEAKALGIDLSLPWCCCIVHLEDEGRDTFAAHGFPGRQRRIIELLAEERQLFVWDCRGDIGILFDNTAPDIQAVGGVVGKIADRDPRLKVAVGIGSRLTGLEGIRKSCRQAAGALLVAKSQAQFPSVCHFRDIGIYKFLANIDGKEQAGEYIGETLGKLIEYDRRKGTDLVHALEEILQNASLKEAARKLFLHYNTTALYKRRIEEILGVPLENAETRLTLAAAVKLHKLRL